MRSTLLRRHLVYALSITLTAVALALYTAGLLTRIAREQETRHLEETAQLVRRVLTLEPAPLEELDALAKALGSETLRVTLIREDGVVLGDSRADPRTLENHGDRPEIDAARGGIVGTAVRKSASVGTELRYLALPAVEHGGSGVFVRVSTPVAITEGQVRGAWAAIGLGALAVLAVATLITYRTQKRMLDPIARLEQAAVAYAEGRFDHQPRVASPPDLARVAESMRGMAAALQDRMNELQSRTRELEAILGSMTEAVVVLDPGLRIHSLNRAATRMARAAEAEVRGRTLLEVFRNTELNEFARKLADYTEPLEASITLEGPTHVQAHGARLEGLEGMVLVLSDISRLRRLEEVRKDFVANVSHELKTPITAVKGYLETLLSGALEDPGTARQFTETASRHANRLGAIVDDLLSLSRLEEKAEVLGDVEPCDLGTIAATVVEIFLPTARAKRIALTRAGRTEARVLGNPRLLEQALSNLVDNAIKYTDAGGSVTVEVQDRPPEVALVVADTGIGIAAKDLERIFERFYRVNKERSRDLGGTGLGLSVVRHIALAHGGRAEAQSTPGVGSRFTLALPAEGEPRTV